MRFCAPHAVVRIEVEASFFELFERGSIRDVAANIDAIEVVCTDDDRSITVVPTVVEAPQGLVRSALGVRDDAPAIHAFIKE